METEEILVTVPREIHEELSAFAGKHGITVDALATEVVLLALAAHKGKASHGPDAHT